MAGESSSAIFKNVVWNIVWPTGFMDFYHCKKFGYSVLADENVLNLGELGVYDWWWYVCVPSENRGELIVQKFSLPSTVVVERPLMLYSRDADVVLFSGFYKTSRRACYFPPLELGL